ncbi:general substrate transporter [Lipomyces chichibuensis]|uniref:general substrate transporter n=1 Tax=Lipomyces chichibuensis TaxID=1546026 RepID=UPI003342EEDB
MVHVLNVYTISAFVALGGLLFGFDISSISGIVDTDQYKNFYGNPLGTTQGLITSAMAGGSLIGALSSSVLGDLLSRKVTIQIGTVFWCIGAALQSASNGIAMLITGRALAGICIGLTSALVPIYQSEIAPRKIRGRVVSFQHFAITCGMTIQYFVEYGCSFIDSTAAFRIPWAIQAVPAIILGIGLFWFPRSPRWLASKDRWDEALKVLAFLRTTKNDINDPLVLAEYREIEDQIRFEREIDSSSLRELISKKMRKRVLLAMAIQMLGQLSGANMLNYYIVYVFQSAGVSNPKLAASFQYLIKVFLTIPAVLWADKWGRRPFLLVGAVIMGFWFFVIGGLFMRYGQPDPVLNQPYTWVIIDHPAVSRTIQACCYLATATFSASWGPVSWIYPPEIVPLRIRSMSVSLALATNWTTNYALGFGVPPLLRSIRWRLFFLFGSFNLLAAVTVWFTAPETKLRTLEEMDEIFEHEKPLWKSFFSFRESNSLDRLAHDIEMEKLGISSVGHTDSSDGRRSFDRLPGKLENGE